MFAFLKGAVMGAVLAFVVAGLIGHGGGTGGMLHVFPCTIEGFKFYWSWALFVSGTGLAWGIFHLLD